MSEHQMASPWNVTLSVFADEIAHNFADQLTHVTAEGLHAIDLRAAWGTNVAELDAGQLDDIRRLLGERSVSVACIGSPVGKSQLSAPFDVELARFRRVLAVARTLQVERIRIFSFYLPEGSQPREHRDEVLRRVGMLATLARVEYPDAMLLHENEKDIYGETPERCKDIIDSIGASNLKAVYDPANFIQVGVRPFTDGFPRLKSDIAYVHIKDAIWGTGQVTPAGQGDGELLPALQALKDRGYDGVLALEPHLSHAGRSSGWTGPEQFHVAVTALRDLLTRVV